VFVVLEGYDVLLLSESAEDLNLSFVLQQKNADEIVARMHAFFFSSDAPTTSNGNGSSSSSNGWSTGSAHPPLHPAGSSGTASPVPISSPIRRSPSRDALLGPSWQSLVATAQSNNST